MSTKKRVSTVTIEHTDSPRVQTFAIYQYSFPFETSYGYEGSWERFETREQAEDSIINMVLIGQALAPSYIFRHVKVKTRAARSSKRAIARFESTADCRVLDTRTGEIVANCGPYHTRSVAGKVAADMNRNEP